MSAQNRRVAREISDIAHRLLTNILSIKDNCEPSPLSGMSPSDYDKALEYIRYDIDKLRLISHY